MNNNRNKSITQICSFSTAIVSILIAGTVFFGWVLNVPDLVHPWASYATMKVNTALGLLLSGVSVISYLVAIRTGSKSWEICSGLTACFAASIGSLTLIEWWAKVDFGIDQLLAKDLTAYRSLVAPGRMGINTATAFLCFGTGQALLTTQSARWRQLGFGLIVAVLMIATFSLVGYLYDVPRLYRVVTFTEMALSTSISFALTAIAALTAFPDEGPAAVFANRSAGGILARRLIPIAVIVPATVGWLELQGQNHGLFPYEFGLAATVLIASVGLTAFAYSTAKAVAREDATRKYSEALKATEEQLQDTVAALAYEKSLMDAVVGSMGSGLVVADRNGNFTLFNNAAERILGVGRSEAKPEEWSQTYGVYTEDTQSPVPTEELPLVLALKGKSVDGCILYVHNENVKDGTWISVNGRPVKQSDGSTIGGVVVFEDVSSRKEAERRVSEFYATVSHELRTPLTSIRGAFGLLEGGKGGELSAKAMHLVKMGKTESDRLVRLINDILDIRKIEAGKVELKLVNLVPATLIQRTVDAMSSMATNLKVTIASQVSTSGTISGDEDRLIQVLTNLISNAIKFSPSGATVTVSATEVKTDLVRFAVTDHGPGIKETELPKLFAMFQQLDQSDSRAKGGTGLGLAISKAIVGQHGGKIGVETVSGPRINILV